MGYPAGFGHSSGAGVMDGAGGGGASGSSRCSTPIELKRRSADFNTLRELERLAEGKHWPPTGGVGGGGVSGTGAGVGGNGAAGGGGGGGGFYTPNRNPVHQAVSAPNLRGYFSTEALNNLVGRKPLTPDRVPHQYQLWQQQQQQQQQQRQQQQQPPPPLRPKPPTPLSSPSREFAGGPGIFGT